MQSFINVFTQSLWDGHTKTEGILKVKLNLLLPFDRKSFKFK